MSILTRSKLEPRKAGALGLAVGVTAALLLTTTGPATAGPADNPDGGSETTGSEAQVGVDCRSDVLHRFVTESVATSTNNIAFATFVGRPVFVPANTSRCLVVEFNAETACHGDEGAADDFCYLRALANGTEMLPLSGGFMAFQSEDATAESNSHRWVRRVSGGGSGANYNVVLQRRSDSNGTQFYMDDWTFSLSVLQ